jgi:hypothetical protein
MFWMHSRASVKRILWLAEGIKQVTAKTVASMHPSGIICLPLHCVGWQYGMVNQVKPGYGGIIAKSWLKMSILKSCWRKNVTQSIKWLSIRR